MRIALFSLTGFGNTILRTLTAAGHEVKFVVTRKENGPFPYYLETNFADEARRLGIEVVYDLPTVKQMNSSRIQILLTATFHKLIPSELIECVDLAVNLHPSPLPAYRGASPIYWTIRNGENSSGITLHYLNAEFDKGDIIGKKIIPVATDETQGSLRKKMAEAAPEIVLSFLDDLKNNNLRVYPQDETVASFFPKFDIEKHSSTNNITNPLELDRQIRALTPWPGPKKT